MDRLRRKKPKEMEKMSNELNVKKALELYQEILKQPIDVKEALFNALRRDLDDEVRGE